MSGYTVSFSGIFDQNTQRDASVVRHRYDFVRDIPNVAMLSRHDHASGGAVCLRPRYDTVTLYASECVVCVSSYDIFFSSGSGMCLSQCYDVHQEYYRGMESLLAGFDICVESIQVTSVLFQSFDVFKNNASVAVSSCYSSVKSVELAQLFSYLPDSYAFTECATGSCEVKRESMVGTDILFDQVLQSTVFSAISIFDSVRNEAVSLLSGYECVVHEMVSGTVFQYDRLRIFERSVNLETDAIIDPFPGGVRCVGYDSFHDVPIAFRVTVCGFYDCPQTMKQGVVDQTYGYDHGSDYYFHLQEEALCLFSVTLVNVVAGFECTCVSAGMLEAGENLAPQCVGNTEWEMELANLVRYHNSSREPVMEESARWRFVTHDGKFWKAAPHISELSVVKLESSFELHFIAEWPYLSVTHFVDFFAFGPPEKGEFFDLGVWISESPMIDTGDSPLLTLPYINDIRNYNVHVPRADITKYIGVAPIRRFPYEEVGALAEIFIP